VSGNAPLELMLSPTKMVELLAELALVSLDTSWSEVDVWKERVLPPLQPPQQL